MKEIMEGYHVQGRKECGCFCFSDTNNNLSSDFHLSFHPPKEAQINFTTSKMWIIFAKKERGKKKKLTQG